MKREEEGPEAVLKDKYRQSENRSAVTRTGFLDAHQCVQAEQFCRTQKILPVSAGNCRTRYALFGGYPDAERRVCVFLPDGQEDVPADLLAVLRVQTARGARPLNHRDYLGSLLALGIDRSVTGDILVGSAEERSGQTTDILVVNEMADYLAREYTEVGREAVHCRVVPLAELHVPEMRREQLTDTVSSLRLDNLIGSAFHVSRSDAQEAIRRGLVLLNAHEETKPDRTVNEGDTVSLRGKGKAVLTRVGEKTKKDRTFIEIERYL